MFNLVILITFTVDDLLILVGENLCWSLLGPQGLIGTESKRKQEGNCVGNEFLIYSVYRMLYFLANKLHSKDRLSII